MLTVTLGTHASGSTWLFNVVRSLFEAAGRIVVSSANDQGAEALDSLPLDATDVVLKCHAMDQRLLRIAQIAGAKIIVSTRDPRDIVVSQRERFGSSIQQSATETSRALVSIASLPPSASSLRYAYEDRFMEHPQTVSEIAAFLELEVSAPAVENIFELHVAERVRARIAAMLDKQALDAVHAHDPITHWHPAHVGDGRSGKWRDKLDVCSQDIVSGCLSPLTKAELWSGKPLIWSAELFSCNFGLPDRPTVDLTAGEETGYLAYGPYLHLPRGRWRAVPCVRTTGFSNIQIEADVFLPWDERRLAFRVGAVTRRGAPDLVLDFEHHDHFQPLETRLIDLRDGTGRISFGGWRLY